MKYLHYKMEEWKIVTENKGKFFTVLVLLLLFVVWRRAIIVKTRVSVLEGDDVSVLEGDDALGCCYDIGFGSRMIPCCRKPHPVGDHKDGTMTKAECPTNEFRIGGETRFKIGTSCEDLEQHWKSIDDD